MEKFRFYIFEIIIDGQTKWAFSKHTLKDLYEELKYYNESENEEYSLQFWTINDKFYQLILTDKIDDIINFCIKYKLK